MELTAKKDIKYKIDKTEGYWVYDEKGNRELDVNCGAFAYTLGYGNQEIINDISTSLSVVTRAHLPLGQTTNDIEEMKHFLLSTGDWSGLVWALSGTGAVEAAVHIGQTYFKCLGDNRNKIITFGKGWHGTSAITKKYSGMWPLTESDNNISLETPVWLTEDERDIQEERILITITNLLESTPEIGQILINPNPWFNGVNLWSHKFWQQLYFIREEYNILIVTDDVASCWGKAKTYHSYKSLMPYGVTPDISAVGKAITAGYAPLSAAVANKKVAEVVQGKVNYSHTFQPYIGGIAAMKAVRRIIERDNLLEKSDWIESELLRIGKILEDNGQINKSKVYGTCAAYYTKDTIIGRALKDRYYGVSSDLAEIPNFRVCIPLIADEEYFYNLEKKLIKGLI